MPISKRLVLHFPKRLVDQPIICRLARDFNLEFNILRASITPREEGLLVFELSGGQEDYDRGIRYLTETGVEIQSLGQNVIRNEEKCIHCGVCVPSAQPLPSPLSLQPDWWTSPMPDALPVDCA